MALAAALWGTIGPAATVISEHTSLSPVQTSFWRLAVALVPLGALALILRRATAPPPRSVVLGGLALGAVTGSSQLAYFAAVAEAGVAVPTLISCGLGPILTAIGQTVIFGARPDARTLAVTVAGVVGLALLVLDSPPQVTAAGVLLSLAAALTYAAYTLAAGPVSRRMGAVPLNATATVGGLLAVLPFVAHAGGPGNPENAAGWIAVAHLGLVVACLAYGLYYRAARILPSTHLTILVLLEPLVAAVLAAALFGEHLTNGAIAGALVLLSAVAALRGEDRRPAISTA